MANKYLKKRKWVILGAILLVLTLTISGTYALWNYFKVGQNQQLVAGEIYMKYKEGTSSINITNAMPTNTYDPSQVFEFTIEGKNTYTKPIWYEIVIKWGEEPEGRTVRIPDKFLRFRLTEQLPDGEETEVIKEGKYSDFSKGKKIWVNTIAANTRTDIKITYKLYMWISDEMVLGSGDAAAGADMDMETWSNDAFASVKVTVNGDFEEKELDKTGVEKLKETLGQEGGIVGIKEDNTKTTSPEDEVREYRYTGLGVKNYVTFNDEKWRILGIFKDENGQEHMKIVRDTTIAGEDMPLEYTVGSKTYEIRWKSSSQNAYWDYDGSNYNNNWAEAGLMYWLNSLGTEDGYLKTLSSTAQGMIEETKWYLGTLTDDVINYTKDTVVEAYKYERAVTGCSENKGPSENNSESKVESNSTCRVWANHAATWTGKIGLMYPSDYGFSASDTYWSGTMLYSYNSAAANTSWLQKEANHTDSEWLLSPSSNDSSSVAEWINAGLVYRLSAQYCDGVRPVLYLKSDIQVTGGEGTSTTPFTLSEKS